MVEVLILFMYLYFVQADYSLINTTIKTPNSFYFIIFCRDSEKLPSCKKPEKRSKGSKKERNRKQTGKLAVAYQ